MSEKKYTVLIDHGAGTGRNEFKAARKRLGLTQKKLSEVLDIPKRTIEDWEGGRRNPPEWVKKLVLEKMESMKQ